MATVVSIVVISIIIVIVVIVIIIVAEGCGAVANKSPETWLAFFFDTNCEACTDEADSSFDKRCTEA